jgi:spore germination protein YaaH
MYKYGILFALAAAACGDVTAADAPAPRRASPQRVEPQHDHRFCGWIYPSRNQAARDRAYDTFAAHAADFSAVHPVWWHVASPTRIEEHAAGADDPRVLENTTARGKKTRLVPTIEATDRPDLEYVHAIINDPALRHAHVAAIVEIVERNGYDGIDLDYEHLSTALGKGQTLATERAAFNAFVAEAAAALHAHGKELTLALPVVGSARGVYDYEALSAHADHIHVMGYDYHYEGGPHLGPVAPLGWIEDAVHYIRTLDGGRRTSRFILGVPNYGLRGDRSELCSPTTACLALVGGHYRPTTDHMSHCGLEDHVDPGRAPNGVTAQGERVYFDDLASLEEKVEAAEKGQLGGIAYWSIGGEPEVPGRETFFHMVRRHFPAD